MSDPLLDFLLSRDREKVLSEARHVSLEALYAEASIEDRGIIDQMPIGVLRRRLAEAERRAVPKVRVVGNRDLLDRVKAEAARADAAEARVKELRELMFREAAGKPAGIGKMVA